MGELAASKGGRKFTDAATRAQIKAQIQRTLSVTLRNSRAPSSKVTTSSLLRYWHDFYNLAQLDPATCFGSEYTVNHKVEMSEANLLSAFATFVVKFPRNKSGQNSADYATQVVASVRSLNAETLGRRPGMTPAGASHESFKTVVKGLRKMAPSIAVRRNPVMQHHLRAVTKTLDLDGSVVDRVLWALWVTQFQGTLRAGDLIRAKGDGARSWCPNRDTEGACLRVGIARDASGRTLGARLTLALKLTKKLSTRHFNLASLSCSLQRLKVSFPVFCKNPTHNTLL